MNENLFIVNDARVKRVQESLERAQADYVIERAEFDAQAATNFAYAVEWRAKHVLRAQARVEVAAELLDEDGTISVAAVARWLRGELNRLDHHDAEAGSTSTITNVITRINRQVRLQYVSMLIG